jgi:two-component system, OmpR family, response regulator BaeR
MSAPAVLVVEDDKKIAALLADYLTLHGFTPVCLGNGLEVAPHVAREEPAAIILDLMIPGQDGMAVCRELRKTSAVPILMLTARIDEIDRLLGLEIGADDYVCKPFSPREVIARVKALVRRAEGRMTGAAQPSAASGFQIDEAGQRVLLDGTVLPLTALEGRLLAALLKQPGRVFSRDQLLDQAHEDFRDVSDRAVDSHVKNIRKKLAAAKPGLDCIQSVYGAGYRYEPD